ncbi:MAG: hypothetical protein KJ592_01030 [Nanoarchaeota archaeon]|nr:hypothetical protein [Nanoarchaeota archaeon]
MDADSLESAINSAKSSGGGESDKVFMSREEEIGFHKGALNTLVAERGELVKMVGNVEAIMQAHIKRLGELGVSL